MLDALADLRAGIHRTIDVSEPDSLWKCEPIVRAAARAGAFTEFINEQLRLASNLETGVGVFAATVFRHPDYRLLVFPVDTLAAAATAAELRDHPENRLMFNLGPGTVVLDLFEQPDMREHDAFDRTKALRRVGQVKLEADGVLRLTAGRDVFDTKAVSEPTVLVVLIGPALHETTWTYDSARLLPRNVSASRLSATRVEYALAVLAELPAALDDEALLRVNDLLDHPAHFVRWAAAKTLHRASEGAGRAALRRLSSDPHPHVRHAVARSLELLNHGD